MKYALSLSLWAAIAGAQQIPNGQAGPLDIGNIIGIFASTYDYVTKVFSEAKADLQSGKTPTAVFEATLPKLLPEAKLHSRVPIASPSLLRANSKKEKASFGPFHLVGKNDYRPLNELLSLDPRGQGKLTFINKGQFCGGHDCTILSARMSTTYADGSEASPATGVYTHHMLSLVPTRSSLNAIGLCDVADPERDLGFLNRLITNRLPFAPFVGRGEDGGPVSMLYTSEDGKYDSGFHLGREDMLVMQSDLVNYRNQTQDVFLTFEYEYVEGISGTMAIPTLLSVTGCLLLIPPKVNATGRAVTTSRKFPITNDATILNIRGHMHDGGEKMILAVNNRTVCESSAEYKDQELWSMSACGKPVDVKKGDWITLTSIYDVAKHPLRAGVTDPHSHAKNILGWSDLMGMFGVVFATKSRDATKM